MPKDVLLKKDTEDSLDDHLHSRKHKESVAWGAFVNDETWKWQWQCEKNLWKHHHTCCLCSLLPYPWYTLCMIMFYHTHWCLCSIHPPLSTWLNNAGLTHTPPIDPGRLMVFVAPQESTLDNRKPKWFGPDTVDTPDQKGPWEESSVLLKGEDSGDKRETGGNHEPVRVLLWDGV